MSRVSGDGLCALLLIVALPAGAAAQAPFFPSDDDLRTTIRYLVEDTPVAGIVLGVLEVDGTTRIVSYGTAGPNARALGPESVFEIGSITKTFTGALLAGLVAQGLVSLEDPVQTYLPDSVRVPMRGGREITLQDLATHFSGLPRLASNHVPADSDDPYADYTIETMYSFLSGHELRREPGAAYEYSNLGFQLLGHAISRAAGSSLADLVRNRILEPLGMARTGYDMEGDVGGWMVQGHRGLTVTSHHTGGDARRGAGGLRANVIDMLQYLKANVDPPNDALGASLRAAQSPRSAFGEQGSRVGLAWVTTPVGDRSIIQHGGATGGFTSRIAFDPVARVGYVLLTNSRLYSDPTMDELLAFGPAIDVADVEVDPAYPATLAGAYSLDGDRWLFLRLEPEGFLTVQQTGRARVRLHALSDTSFAMKQVPMTLTAQRDEAGGVHALLVERRGGAPRTAERSDREVPDPETVRAGIVFSSLALEWTAVLRLAAALTASIGVLAILVLGIDARRRARSARGVNASVTDSTWRSR